MNTWVRSLARCIALAGLAIGSPSSAAPIEITVDTSPLAGMAGTLAFDLIDGGPPSNSVTIGSLGGSGTLGSTAPSTGDVSGALPGAVILGDGSFFNEYLQQFTIGSVVSFIFDSTGHPADAGSIPDAFAFFILNAAATAPLAHSSDPTGADTLFAFDIGEPSPIRIFGSDEVIVRVGPVTINTVPEPATMGLVVIALVAGAAGLRRAGQRRVARVSSATLTDFERLA